VIYISIPAYTVGLLFGPNGIITHAPRIAHWTVGRHVKFVKRYYEGRGARVEYIEEFPQAPTAFRRRVPLSLLVR
jgi:hypothetical protein